MTTSEPDRGLGLWSATALATIWPLALVTMAGLRVGARVFGLLTAAKLCTLGGIVLLALGTGAGRWSNFVPFVGTRVGAPPLGEAFALALVGVFFSCGGFWEASRIAGEVRDPRRTVPRALVLGVLSVTTVYVMTTLVFIYLVPPAAATSAPEFARRAGEALLGPVGPPVLAAIVVLSVVASAMAMIMVAPRLYEAMSHDRLFPALLARRHPTTGAPVRATALLAGLASLFVLAGTFDEIVAFFICTTLVFIALAAAAVFVVRRRSASAGGAFRVPGYPITPALFVLLVLAVVTMVAMHRPLQALAGLVVVLIGLPVQRLLVAPPVHASREGDR